MGPSLKFCTFNGIYQHFNVSYILTNKLVSWGCSHPDRLGGPIANGGHSPNWTTRILLIVAEEILHSSEIVAMRFVMVLAPLTVGYVTASSLGDELSLSVVKR